MNINAQKIISLFLALVILTCSATVVNAVQPRYSDTSSVSLSLKYSGTTAYCQVTVNCTSDITGITNGSLVLRSSKGNVVKSWTNLTSNSNTLSVFKTVSGLTSGETYTLNFSAKVNSTKTEVISSSISKTCWLSIKTYSASYQTTKQSSIWQKGRDKVKMYSRYLIRSKFYFERKFNLWKRTLKKSFLRLWRELWLCR